MIIKITHKKTDEFVEIHNDGDGSKLKIYGNSPLKAGIEKHLASFNYRLFMSGLVKNAIASYGEELIKTFDDGSRAIDVTSDKFLKNHFIPSIEAMNCEVQLIDDTSEDDPK